MSIDGSGSKGVGANSFDEDALFTLPFHLMSLFLPGAGVCGDDQSTADKEEAENTGTNGADKPDTGRTDAEEDSCRGRANVEEDPSPGGVDKPDTSGADKPGTGGTNKPGTSGVDKPGTSGAEKAEERWA